MELKEYFRFQFPAFQSVSDEDVKTSIKVAKDHRLGGSKQRGDMSQCLYAAYLLSLRQKDVQESSRPEFGAQSIRLGEETRTYVTGSDRSQDLLDPMGYLARYTGMKKEGSVFLATLGRRG